MHAIHTILRKSLPIMFLALASMPVHALDIAGAHFDEKAGELVLNGAGLRTKLFFKIYAIGLYLPQKADGADTVLALKTPRRIQIVTLRDLTAEQLTDAFLDSINANQTEQEMAKLTARVERFRATMLSVGKVAEKTPIRLDYLPASGTRLTVGTEQKGTDIPGEDFYQALLRIWLGNAPVQADLKEKLLGKP